MTYTYIHRAGLWVGRAGPLPRALTLSGCQKGQSSDLWKYIFESVIVVKVMLQILLLCSDEKFSVSIFLLRLNDRVSSSITDTSKLSIY
jgi:hypothetical protein